MLLVLGLRALRVSETPSKIHSPGKRSACYNVVASRRRESMDSDARDIGYSASSNGDSENIFEEEKSDPGCSSNSSLAEAQLAMRLEEGRVGQASKQASKRASDQDRFHYDFAFSSDNRPNELELIIGEENQSERARSLIICHLRSALEIVETTL
ncbi:hypothetical protein HZH68_012724 [Vespula germanica]|uniref:Uncharacterized protein n=1 Tax=Vespula germanica TaxID=30212 RepID=A0A834MVM7_VESGE|nr:hypothetical protein HZH68_012724 [Vespula germanica]